MTPKLTIICCGCEKIKNDNGEYSRPNLDVYMQLYDTKKYSLSHGMCDECLYESYPAMANTIIKNVREEAVIQAEEKKIKPIAMVEQQQ